ncbi:acyl-ACP thioesterase domain-containing protein [Maridesulfovibrio sp.]|uniref:acyl-[acyl-carrier-protein] thioesterase n=1 Tax=Maridesulfovibrio sp. TaxID=2795000 RepID=UPI002A18E255|nr:acyl-ACP thioesterase domain-containing protein [Maridesulfovibrio sp.]
MSGNSFLIENRVPAYETGPDDRMHCHWLMCRLQEAATAHADSLGFGIADMAARNSFWVLTSLRIEVEELPLREKKFALETWSRGAKKLRAFRDFCGCDASGREIIRASSEWMVLDSATRKPVLVDKALNLKAQDKTVFPDAMKRLRPGTPEREIRTLKVGYSSLDANGHVNNTEYLRWSLDSLRPLGFDQNKVKSIRIAFLSEVFEGNVIKLMDCESRDGGFELLGINETEDRAAFALQIK